MKKRSRKIIGITPIIFIVLLGIAGVHVCFRPPYQNPHLVEARKWLDTARTESLEENVEFDIKAFRGSVEEGNLKMEEVGTSDEEIASLLITGWHSEVVKWLGYARKATDDIESDLYILRKYLNKGKWKLENFGSSEEEIEKLLIASYKAAAQKRLEMVRKSADDKDVDSTISAFRGYVQKSRLSLADFSTSDEELKALQQQGYISEAGYYLEQLRAGERELAMLKVCARHVREYASKAGIPLSSLNTSEEELTALGEKGREAEEKKED